MLYYLRGREGGALHKRRFDIVNGQDAILLAIHRLRKEAKGFLNLALFLRRDVVLLGELRLPRFGRGGGTAGFALRRLFWALLVSSLFYRCGCFLNNIVGGTYHVM
jgi:hypothetical protein